MFLAKKIKESSEVGYILYMWQVEDIVRAMGCDADNICRHYVPQLGLEGESLVQEEQWWKDIVEMMRSEGIFQQGHLQVAKGTLSLLADKHAELLSDARETTYNALYYKVLPYIVEMRAKSREIHKDSPAEDKNELEVCLEILYGVTLLQIKKQEITPQTRQAHDDVVAMLNYLNQKYKEEKAQFE